MTNPKLNLAQTAQKISNTELIERAKLKNLKGGGFKGDPPPLEEN